MAGVLKTLVLLYTINTSIIYEKTMRLVFLQKQYLYSGHDEFFCDKKCGILYKKMTGLI